MHLTNATAIVNSLLCQLHHAYVYQTMTGCAYYYYSTLGRQNKKAQNEINTEEFCINQCVVNWILED